MLPDGPDVEQVMYGPGGLIENARPGAVFVDMSSINPGTSQRLGETCQARGLGFLDAPVSGGDQKAIDGTLAIMVGGDQGLFDSVKPVLKAMGSTITLTGPVGAGNTTKLANQIIVACNIAAVGEALVLTTRAGLDPEVVYMAIKDGLAGSAVLNAKAPAIIARNFKPGFKLRLHQKDLRNALTAAKEIDVPLPLTAEVQGLISEVVNEGRGDDDHGGLVAAIEKRGHVTIAKR
jgi:2-hydroxy-3-oxopropionate reductase